MKNVLLLVLAITGCATAPQKDATESNRGGHKQYLVVLTSTAGGDENRNFTLVPKNPDTEWTREEKRSANMLIQALELSGYKLVKNKTKGALSIEVDFPKVSQASGFTFTALLGGSRHYVEIDARTQKKSVWSMKAYTDHESDDPGKTFSYMALAMVGKFNTTLKDENVSVDEYDSRLEKIKADPSTTP